MFFMAPRTKKVSADISDYLFTCWLCMAQPKPVLIAVFSSGETDDWEKQYIG
jgi:hypothetical protein